MVLIVSPSAETSVSPRLGCERRSEAWTRATISRVLNELGQVVVGAVLEAEQLVHLRGARGEHDHRQVPSRRLAPHLSQDLETIAARQHEIEHQQVGAGGEQLIQALVPVGRDGHAKSRTLEVVTEQVADFLLVLDHHHQSRQIGPRGAWAGGVRGSGLSRPRVWFPASTLADRPARTVPVAQSRPGPITRTCRPCERVGN